MILAAEQDVFAGQNFQQVFHELTVKNAAVGTGADDPFNGEKHDAAVGFSENRDRTFPDSGTGESFSENLAGLQLGQNRTVAVIVFLNDLHFTGQHNPDRSNGLSGHQDDFAAVIFFFFAPQTLQHVFEFVIDGVKELNFSQNFNIIIHFFNLFPFTLHMQLLLWVDYIMIGSRNQ